jgi:hypothetical protein
MLVLDKRLVSVLRSAVEVTHQALKLHHYNNTLH